jgi:cyclic pyranopterin phosphate synthase
MEQISSNQQREHVLIDRFNRKINYLRISITDKCNLRCIYCMPPFGERKLRHKDILRYEELLRIARIAITLGITKIRLTGGEPLVRKGVDEFIPMLTALEGLMDVSITTNGVLLKQNLKMLKAAGIKRLNISIDSLDRRKFEKITRFDHLDQVWEGIASARDMGFHPIKLNVVMMKGINDDEILDFGRLALEQPYHLRFIECMPIGLETNSLAFVANQEVEKALVEAFGPLIPVLPGPYDGPAERFRFEHGKGEIGFVSAISRSFCDHCNRLRLTANGMLLPCLLSDTEISIKDPLRRGCLDGELIEVFRKAVRLKPACHPLNGQNNQKVHRKMCSVGG